ncbi:DnaJ domain-containing protein [Salinarimonas ramus]|uniref:Molecular chaperone DnaJ n=1 Tax=Salinarimonas ramus TaxID=690164 RepID=A0A917QC28_9HYPH|nr:DnaJ domain-containing protein [Salinarimonas ramus]GGK39934.1 molecular chaperone DnaJ [Salinarimonas ramus]
MITLMYGLAAFVAFWWLMRAFAKSNPKDLSRLVKRIGGGALIAVSVLLAVRGRIDMAILTSGFGAWLLGWSLPWARAIPGLGGGSKSSGQVSRVRSAMLEMELCHDSGDMDGTVLAGSHSGKRLSQLDEAALQELYREAAARDADGVRLLQAYFDRRFPGWRENAQGDADAGAARETKPGAMSEEEAYQILGLEPGADAQAVRRAHRSLMMKLHPDQGGSTYLAARVNEAKEVLLSRHR